MEIRIKTLPTLLAAANVCLLVISLVILALVAVLIEVYHLPHLNFWSSFASTTAHLMIALGVYAFAVAAFGLAINAVTENRKVLYLLHVAYCILLFLVILLHGGSVFSAMEMRNEVDTAYKLEYLPFLDDVRLYPNDTSIASSLDDLQRKLHCCGGKSYKDYLGKGVQLGEEAPSGRIHVPDSCCKPIWRRERCGRNVSETQRNANHRIFTEGCIDMLEDSLREVVMPVMLGYSVAGLAVMILEMAVVAAAVRRFVHILQKSAA